MAESRQSRVPLLLWPFYAVWKLLSFVLELTGRLLCALLGVAFMAAGVILSLSVAGAVIGVPIAAFGFLLAVRALF